MSVQLNVAQASPEELHATLDKAREAYKSFRLVPAPRRGEVLRQIREGTLVFCTPCYTLICIL